MAEPQRQRGMIGDKAVAFVSDYALDYTGGAQTAMIAEARSLAAVGVRVILIVPDSQTTLPLEGLDVRLLPAWRLPVVNLPVIRNSLRRQARLAAIFREEGVGVVHVHSEFGLAVAAIEAAAWLSIPSVITVHTFFWRGPLGLPGILLAPFAAMYLGVLTGRRPRLSRRFKGTRDALGGLLRDVTRSAAARADVVVSPSRHQAEALRRAGLARVEILPNTALPCTSAPSDPGVGLGDEGPLRLVWIGRCAPEKRLLPFIEACLLVLERRPDAITVEVIGTGPSLAQAARLAAGSTAVHFHGFVENTRVGDAIRASDLVVLTSFGFDNQPVVIIEALREGRGVVYVDPALEEGLEGAGLPAPVEPAGFADFVEWLSDRRTVVANAGAAARASFASFSPDAHAAAVLDLYRKARNASARPSPDARRG